MIPPWNCVGCPKKFWCDKHRGYCYSCSKCGIEYHQRWVQTLEWSATCAGELQTSKKFYFYPAERLKSSALSVGMFRSIKREIHISTSFILALPIFYNKTIQKCSLTTDRTIFYFISSHFWSWHLHLHPENIHQLWWLSTHAKPTPLSFGILLDNLEGVYSSNRMGLFALFTKEMIDSYNWRDKNMILKRRVFSVEIKISVFLICEMSTR